MSWIEIAWTMMASACLTLGSVHLYVWQRQRSHYASLLFFALAASVAAFVPFELAMMSASTPEAYATAVRWGHVPLSVAVFPAVGFVHFHFGSDRPWLGYATCAAELLALVLNFTTGVNVNFTTITALDHATLWGGAVVSVPIGVLNPSFIAAEISNALLLAFFADASFTLWKRGDFVSRRRALALGGSLFLCVLFAASLAFLGFSGHVRAPTLMTPAFFLVVMAMGYELGESVIQAEQLSRDLRESERRSELAAQAAGLAFWSWNALTKDFWISASGRALFGLSTSESGDLDTLLTRLHPEDRNAVRHTLDETVRSGGTFEQEIRMLMDSGTRWIAARGQMGVGSTETPALLRGVAFDITARVQMERELTNHRQELAHISRVSTAGTLAGSIAHEINQPLMGILANAEAAQSLVEAGNVHGADLCEIHEDIVLQAKNAGDVIRRLRELLRKGHAQLAPLAINVVVDDVVRLTRQELRHRGVTASLSLRDDLPPVRADRVQMQQVLLNLVMNACDAMSACSGSARVQICTRSKAADAVEISVADCGCGIPPADLERIFEPFVTTKIHGMGLGLSVCRTIIAAHGGRLWAENNFDAGATFRVTLPVTSVAL